MVLKVRKWSDPLLYATRVFGVLRSWGIFFTWALVWHLFLKTQENKQIKKKKQNKTLQPYPEHILRVHQRRNSNIGCSWWHVHTFPISRFHCSFFAAAYELHFPMRHNINVFPCWLPSPGVTARVSQHKTPNHKSPLNNTDGRRVTGERASRSEQSGIDAWQMEQLDHGPSGQVESGAAFS